MMSLSRALFLVASLLSTAISNAALTDQLPVAMLLLNGGEPIVRANGMFTVAAVNKGRSSGFFEGRVLEIRRSENNQERIIGYARVTAAEDDHSFVVVESPSGLALSRNDRFTISQADSSALGFQFMSKEGLKRPPTFISFFNNGRLLLIANQDEFMIWDWRSERKVQSVSNSHGVYFTAFSLNKRINKLRVLSSAVLYEWDLNKMQISRSVPVEGGQSFPMLAESADGSVIVHTAQDREAVLLDSELKEIGRIENDEKLGNMHWQTDLSSDGALFLTVHTRLEPGGAEGVRSPRSVLLWDTKQRKLIRKLAEQEHDPSIVRFVPPDNSVAYDTDDRQLVFISSSGEKLASTPLGENGISGLEFSPSGQLFVTKNTVGEVKLWKYPSLESQVIASDGGAGFNPSPSPIAFSSDEKYVSAGLTNAVGIWEVSTGKLLRRLEGSNQEAVNILASQDGRRLVIASRHSVETWDLNRGSMNAQAVPDIRFATLGTMSGRLVSVGHAETKKYFGPIPGFDPATLTLSVLDGTTRNDIATWGARDLEDYAVTPDEKYLVRVDVWNLSTMSLADGSMVHSRPVVTNEEYEKLYPEKKASMGNSLLLGKVQLSRDGRALAFGRDDGLLRIWELDSGKIGKDLYTNRFVKVEAFSISPDFNTIVVSGGGNKLTAIDRSSKKVLYELPKPGLRIDKIVWDPQATKFAVVASNRLHLFASRDGSGLYSRQFITPVADVAFSSDGVFLFVGSSGGQTHVLRADTGRRVAQLVSQQPAVRPKRADNIGEKARQLFSRIACFIACDAEPNKERNPRWLAFTEESRFDIDGFSENSEFSWVVADNPLTPVAPEIFMRDYYEPRLLPRLLACHEAEARGYDSEACKKAFPPVRSLAKLNRVQPKVKIKSVKRGSSANEALVEVEVTRGNDRSQRNGKTETAAYDLRLFRDGQLVGKVPQFLGEVGGSDDILDWRKQNLVIMDDGKASATRLFRVELASRNKGERTRFTAYAFNEDRVKSETGEPEDYKVPRDVKGRKPRAYVISIGVSAYQTPKWRLSFAAKDAREISAVLQKIEGYEVVALTLISTDGIAPMDQATKANIQDVLAALGGDVGARDRVKNSVGSIAEKLLRVTPDDLVIVAYSGHGHTDSHGRFYLLPSDGKIDNDRFYQFISSEELSQWLRSIDAGQLVFIIDACHSAASVPRGFKPGPMGDRGLGQIAYDKGMRILAATQADDIALESKKLGQGLLTYALVQDGLYARKAASKRGSPITIKAWLGYAESRVPELYREVLSGKLKMVRIVGEDSKDLLVRDSGVDAEFVLQRALHAQTPTLFDFYRMPADPVLSPQ